jgi:hypothetical protein
MSYTELKTINGDSIKGSGDLVVTGGGVSDGDYGDITVSSSGTVWEIDAATVGVTELSATGTPSATTFLRGDNTWAAPASVDPAGWTVIVKSANQDVTNSATLVNDTDLQFSVVAGGHYMIEMDVVISSNNTTGDYQNRFSVSAGTMLGKGFMIGPTATGAAQVNEYSANAVTISTPLVLGSPVANIDFLVSTKIIFSFQASANATLSYQFANAAAGAGRTSRTWKGSILKYKRID